MFLLGFPKSTSEAMNDLNWCQAMVEEMDALNLNNTLEIVTLSLDKTTVGCRWVYIMEDGPDG